MEHVNKRENIPKIGYLTEKVARESALAMKHKYNEEFVFYKCRVCGLWHVGHAMEDVSEKEVMNEVE